MARHNILIQRHVAGPDGADANVPGKCAKWSDCGTSDYKAKDRHGNTGFGDNIKEARRQVQCLRVDHPREVYRLVQIID